MENEQAFLNKLQNDLIRNVQNERDALIKAAMIKKGFDLPIEEYIDRGMVFVIDNVKTFYIDDIAICSFTEMEPVPFYAELNSKEPSCKITMEFKFQEL